MAKNTGKTDKNGSADVDESAAEMLGKVSSTPKKSGQLVIQPLEEKDRSHWRLTRKIRGLMSGPQQKGVRNSTLRGRMTRDAVARMVLVDKMKPAEIAETLGLSRVTVDRAWARAVKEYGAGTLDEEEVETMRGFVRANIEQVIEESAELVKENAAYGALVIKGGETLLKMHGIETVEPGDGAGKVTEEDLADRVRAVSPLIANKLKSARAAMRKVRKEVEQAPSSEIA